MQDQPIGPDASRLGNETEFVVLALPLDPKCPGPWSVAELAREVGFGQRMRCCGWMQQVLCIAAAALCLRRGRQCGLGS